MRHQHQNIYIVIKKIPSVAHLYKYLQTRSEVAQQTPEVHNFRIPTYSHGKPKLFREYIGDENNAFADVSVDVKAEFHFILSFAIDYKMQSHNPSSANGDFSFFWDTENHVFFLVENTENHGVPINRLNLSLFYIENRGNSNTPNIHNISKESL